MLIVEDGTGLNPDANTYIDISFIEKYLNGERLNQFNALTNDHKEAAIINATIYVDNVFKWRGTRASAEQPLNFPRIDLFVDNFEITNVPNGIKRAVAEATFLNASGEAFFTNEADKTIASEKVDVISVSYFNPKDIGIKDNATRFEVLNMLVRPYLQEEQKKGGSSIGTAQVIRS